MNLLFYGIFLSGGLELGSHNALCWPAVLAACRHVCRLEHVIFTGPAPPVSLQQNNTVERNVSMSYHAGEEDETWYSIKISWMYIILIRLKHNF